MENIRRYINTIAIGSYLTLLLITSSCNQLNTTQPSQAANVQLTSAHFNIEIGTIGQLAKNKTINLKSLVLIVTCPGQDTIRDTTTISGTGGNNVKVTIGGLKAPRTWTVAAKTFDTKDSCIHRGSTTFVTIPADTAEVSLNLMALYSMLKVSFNGIPDSAVNLTVTINGNVFTAESSFVAGNLDTIMFSYDYLAASSVGIEHTISMKAWGGYYGKDTVLYAGDTTFTVTSGENKNYPVTLKWVGPVEEPPVIISHPTAQTVVKGETATFRIAATGTDLSYQWRKGTADIVGANDTTYTTPPVTDADNGTLYSCVVSSRGKSSISNAARITVVQFALPFVVDDLSDGDLLNNVGFLWYYYDDDKGVGPNDRSQIAPNSTSSIINVPYSERERYAFGDMNDTRMIKEYTFKVDEIDGNNYASMPFTLGDMWAADYCNPGVACAMPYVAIGTFLAPTPNPSPLFPFFLTSSTLDLTGVSQISFSIKSRVGILQNVTFKIQTYNIDEYSYKPGSEMIGDEFGYYSYTFSVNPGVWQEITVRIADLNLPGIWAHDFDFDITKCTTLVWEIKGEGLTNYTDTLDIDNVIFK